MQKKEKDLFDLVNKLSKKRYGRFAKYYVGDVKPFINKISRDYEKSRKFPVHVLKMIKKIPKDNYYCAVCILRGGLTYSLLFEAAGWKVHYVVCGRIGRIHSTKNRRDLIFNEKVDSSIKEIKEKRILLIDNNSPSGSTPLRTYEELKRIYRIKKPGLFLDYFLFINSHSRKNKPPYWLKKPFWRNKDRQKKFEKLYIANELKVSVSERKKLIDYFLKKVKKLK